MANPLMSPARVAGFGKTTNRVPTVEPTPAQRTRARELTDILRVINAGEVWQESDGRSVETDSEYFGYADPIADVTEEVACAEAAGLATTRPLDHGAGAAWELTPAGAEVLAELDAKEV